jgi:hypothetical protein
MDKAQVADVPVDDHFKTVDEFIAEVRMEGRRHIHVVKVDDQGITEPTKKGNVFVQQPKVRIVVTALDDTKPEILRYEKKWEVGSGVVSINVFSGRGEYFDLTGKKTRDDIVAALEARGLQVSKGEWTKESAAAALR